jgi:putative aldouronate transport system permease protein
MFNFINMIIMMLIIFITLYPLWYVFIASFSSPTEVSKGSVILFPIGFELTSFKKVFEMDNIWKSYGNTIFYSVFGTAISITLTILAAYPLSKKRLRGRKIVTFLLLVTMWFSPGMMPTYLNFKSLGLLDKRLGILLCVAVSTFYVILLRTYFESISDSMEESAKIDGASDWSILIRIYLPLSVPALATIMLYYFVGRWNSYFWSMLLLSDQSKVPLQVLLRKLIVKVTYTVNEAADVDMKSMTEQTIVYATIVVAVVPMLILYPFVQRFFVKGIMVGAIKG